MGINYLGPPERASTRQLAPEWHPLFLFRLHPGERRINHTSRLAVCVFE
jgi:hypothetical protein